MSLQLAEEDTIALPSWWPATFDLEIPCYSRPVDETLAKANYLISMALVARGKLRASRNDYLAAQRDFNEALTASAINELARTLRDSLRWMSVGA